MLSDLVGQSVVIKNEARAELAPYKGKKVRVRAVYHSQRPDKASNAVIVVAEAPDGNLVHVAVRNVQVVH
jgi:hypothetical protein